MSAKIIKYGSDATTESARSRIMDMENPLSDVRDFLKAVLMAVNDLNDEDKRRALDTVLCAASVELKKVQDAWTEIVDGVPAEGE
jgi:hypothetical protein